MHVTLHASGLHDDRACSALVVTSADASEILIGIVHASNCPSVMCLLPRAGDRGRPCILCTVQGNTMAASGDLAGAREAYAEAAELDGKCFQAHYNYGHAPPLLQWSHGFQLRLSAPTKQCNRFSAIFAQTHVSAAQPVHQADEQAAGAAEQCAVGLSPAGCCPS